MRCSWPRDIRSEIRQNAVGKNVLESHRATRRELAMQLPAEIGLRMQHTTVSRSPDHAINTSETDGTTGPHGHPQVRPLEHIQLAHHVTSLPMARSHGKMPLLTRPSANLEGREVQLTK